MSTTEQPMGEVVREGDLWRLRYERQLRHAPEKVWRALTESQHLAHWMPCDMVGERRQGAIGVAAVLARDRGEVRDEGDARAARRDHGVGPADVFEWMWDVDRLRFELTPTDDGTLLTFTTWLGEPSTEGSASTAAGYHVCLDHLVQLLDTGDAPGVVDADPTELERRYEAAVNAAS